MEENKKSLHPNIRLVLQRTGSHKKTLFKVLVVTFAISCLLVFPIPRYYTSNISLAPEIGGQGTGNKVSSIASSLGFNIGGTSSSDAISPALYPELIGSNSFIKNLANIQVVSKDGKIKTSYYNYLDKKQKNAFYLIPLRWGASQIRNIFAERNVKDDGGRKINPFRLDRRETEIFEKIRNNIQCEIDIKTDLITISVTDQDPLIAATIADSVRSKLQHFIILYRTNKARIDLNYYKKLTQEAKQKYERARQKYAFYADSNNDVLLMSFKSKTEDLENDMQLKFNTYSTLNTQLQAAIAKVQEQTPAFTMIQGASVPVRAAGPKRMAFVITMLFVAFLLTISYINKDLFFS